MSDANVRDDMPSPDYPGLLLVAADAAAEKRCRVRGGTLADLLAVLAGRKSSPLCDLEAKIVDHDSREALRAVREYFRTASWQFGHRLLQTYPTLFMSSGLHSDRDFRQQIEGVRRLGYTSLRPMLAQLLGSDTNRSLASLRLSAATLLMPLGAGSTPREDRDVAELTPDILRRHEVWQERLRRAAHAIWEREGRPEGKGKEHWDRAEQEVWLEDFMPAREFVCQLEAMRSALDKGTDQGLLDAAHIGCLAMTALLSDGSVFINSFRSADPDLSRDLWVTLINDNLWVDDFLAVQQQIWAKAGTDPVLIQQVIEECRRQIQLIRDDDAVAVDHGHLLNMAKHRACQAEEQIKAERDAEKLAAKWRLVERCVQKAALGATIYVVAEHMFPGSGAYAVIAAELTKAIGEHCFAEGIAKLGEYAVWIFMPPLIPDR